MSFGGNGGAVFHEVRHALYESSASFHCELHLRFRRKRHKSKRLQKSLQRLAPIIAQNKRVDKLVHYVGLEGVMEEKKMATTQEWKFTAKDIARNQTCSFQGTEHVRVADQQTFCAWL